MKWFPGGLFYILDSLNKQKTDWIQLFIETLLYPLALTKYQILNIWRPRNENYLHRTELEILRGCLDTPFQLFIQTWLITNGLIKNGTLYWSSIGLKDWHGNNLKIPYLAHISICFSLITILKTLYKVSMIFKATT